MSTEKQEEKMKLKSGDWLLLLLYSRGVNEDANEPITGKTRLVKMIFVFEKECLPLFKKGGCVIDEHSLPEFFPWKFGPMSKDVLEDLDFFVKIKFIQQIEVKNSFAFEEADEISSFTADNSLDTSIERDYIDYTYTLTVIGKKYVEEKLLSCFKAHEIVLMRELKKRFNKATLREILRYVYEKYEDYTDKSIIKDTVL